MRLLTIFLVSLAAAGCSIIYKLPTRQGNVVEQSKLDQLQNGMTREQVRFLLGTPIATSPFRTDRWDYFGYYKSPHGEISSRNVVVYFDNDKLSRIEGLQVASAETGPAKASDTPDVDSLVKQEKQEKKDTDRARDEGATDKQTGVDVLKPANTAP